MGGEGRAARGRAAGGSGGAAGLFGSAGWRPVELPGGGGLEGAEFEGEGGVVFIEELTGVCHFVVLSFSLCAALIALTISSGQEFFIKELRRCEESGAQSLTLR